MELPGIFITMKEMARLFGISRSSLYNYMKECDVQHNGKLVSPAKQMEILEAINRRNSRRPYPARAGTLSETE